MKHQLNHHSAFGTELFYCSVAFIRLFFENLVTHYTFKMFKEKDFKVLISPLSKDENSFVVIKDNAFDEVIEKIYLETQRLKEKG